jgi:rhamnosyltransferase subunit B
MSERVLLFVGFGSLGDICPLLAVAEKMKRIHEVVFLANEYFRDFVEQRGLAFHSIGKVEDQLSARESEQSTGETREGRIHRFDNVIGKSFAPAFDYIGQLVQTGRKPVVISHGNLSPAALACEAFNVPLILTYYSPSHILHNDEDSVQFFNFYRRKEWFVRYIEAPWRKLRHQMNFEVGPLYNQYRTSLGLRPLPGVLKGKLLKLTDRRPFGPPIPLQIALLPRWFCEPIDSKLAQVKFVGFAFLSPRRGPPDPELEAFLSKHPRPIVFTPGTAVEDVRGFCEHIIPICRKLGAPGIFAAKHGKAAFDSLPKADDVPLLFLEHADFDSLLPRARCLIHHGGIGTIAQAIRAGIPQILRPRMYDQPANGIRVMSYGLGGSLAPSHFRAEIVANVLAHIENSPLHAERIPYYANLVRQESGVDNCIRHIEHYLDEATYEHQETAENLQLC